MSGMWPVMLKNSVALVCWTVLAVVFGRWWIALFSVLFLSSVKWR